ncbi:monovalent cation/H(+) antiporter subunit G [uncultured Methanocorpusculum sp.]|nr:monovalent cation/H(+) antiporter subunit G [uncultured Methanocorpusculum sp.]
MIDIIVTVCVVISLIFCILGVIGLFRFPDFYTRIHAAGLVSSLGFLFMGAAVLTYAVGLLLAGDEAWLNFSTHLVLALLVVVITGTTATHAIARSAYRSGNMPISKTDALKADEPKMKRREERK